MGVCERIFFGERNPKLVGELYGVAIRNAFYGESMFSLVPNDSKLALIHLARALAQIGGAFIDGQFAPTSQVYGRPTYQIRRVYEPTRKSCLLLTPLERWFLLYLNGHPHGEWMTILVMTERPFLLCQYNHPWYMLPVSK